MTKSKESNSGNDNQILDLSQFNYLDAPDAIVIAASVCQWDLVEYLLNNGADIETRDEDGNTALLAAVNDGSSYTACEHLVTLLLECGANPNACNQDGDAPLDIACYLEKSRLIELLLAKGAKKKDGPSQKELDENAMYEAFETANAVRRLVSLIDKKEDD
jgi:ankyrin repeat protein